MRHSRPKRMEQKSRYFITAKAAGGQFLFDDDTLEYFRELMLKVAYFCGVKILAYSLLKNHFHLLIMVLPYKTAVSDTKVIRRIRRLYGNKLADELKEKVAEARERGDTETIAELLEPYRRRMNELPEFLKTLKQRMSQYVNGKLKREGTVWQGRFHSVIIENDEHLMRIVASYIDLNPVRATILSDFRWYRWSSIGDSFSEGQRKRIGLKMVGALYPSLPPEKARDRYAALLDSKLRLSPGDDPLLCVNARNPYLSKSKAIGKEAFIRKVAGKHPIGGVTPLRGNGCLYLSVGRVTKRK